ncbi:GspH/FimT family pseudopilin [Hydrogenophaga sp. T2]|uniref:GspH/FimT family pseudopilin n=1 Tax=Hydrogenophaga sp. T2 TaxID=3132823 RepID=UPI003CFAB4E0
MRVEKHSFLPQRGFTLIELMVGITILAILLAIAVPSFRGSMASSRVTSSTNEIVSALALARSEAIRRGTRISVCKSTNGTGCAAAGGWEQGWIVFVDTNRPGGDAAVNAGDVVLTRTGPQAGELSILGTAAVANYLSFAADGTVRNMAGTALAGRLRVCSTSTAINDARRAREIDVSSAGRIATSVVSLGAACAAPA